MSEMGPEAYMAGASRDEEIDEEEHERRHFHSVMAALSQYKLHALKRVQKTEKFIQALPLRHVNRLEKYCGYLSKFRWCIDQNNFIIKDILKDAVDIFDNIPSSKICPPGFGMDEDAEVLLEDVNGRSIQDMADYDYRNPDLKPRIENFERVQHIFKLLYRDWSESGLAERKQCYQPIINEILKEFPAPSDISVLVPGAGLGRLAFEIAMNGYRCQGNEFSLFMLFASNYVLNKCHKINGFKVYPWVHQFVNNLTCEHQIRETTFPDVDPSILSGADFSMTAGDFLTVYTTPDDWNCVATCFFIDCASNVINFIETIYKILKPGAIWINLGPLLYHYSDMNNQDSIEPPFDILCDIITDVGFNIEKTQTGIKTKYTQNPNSMLPNEYESVFFVCRKPIRSAS